jgi:uncharacterized protein YndB with AHSA1/START domain
VGKLQFTTRINAPVVRVYQLYTSAKHIPQWFPKAIAVTHVTGPLDRVGSKYVIEFDGQPNANEEVLEADTNLFHRRSFLMGSPIGVRGLATARFEAIGEQTSLTFDVQYGIKPGFLGFALEPLMKARIESSVRAEIEAFKGFVEKDA